MFHQQWLGGGGGRWGWGGGRVGGGGGPEALRSRPAGPGTGKRIGRARPPASADPTQTHTVRPGPLSPGERSASPSSRNKPCIRGPLFQSNIGFCGNTEKKRFARRQYRDP